MDGAGQRRAVQRRAATAAGPPRHAPRERPAAAVLGEGAASRPSGNSSRDSRLAWRLTDDVLYGDVWRRPELSPRDRSLVTISVLIATGKTAQLGGPPGASARERPAPTETSGVLAHLAIYCGWPSAVSALQVYEQVYAARKVDTAALRAVGAAPSGAPASVPGALRSSTHSLPTVAPKFAQLTTDVVFGDLWRRSDLGAARSSLVTIAALACNG